MGALAVIIGAFGAHAFKSILAAKDTLQTFETASKYHFYHTLALLLTAILIGRNQSSWLNYAAFSFTIGTLIFSGSLYTLSLTGQTKWGAIAPIGGILLVAGWVMLVIAFWRKA